MNSIQKENIIEIITSQTNYDKKTAEQKLKEWDDDFIKVIKDILLNAEKDPAFASELLSLPSENEIAENLKKYDPDKVFEARREIIKTIKSNLSQEFYFIYKQNFIFTICIKNIYPVF